MKTIYREQLDGLLQAQFSKGEGHLEMMPEPKSHAKHGLLVHYKDGRLHIFCGKCKERVAVVAVASEPSSEALSA